jgi:CTP synthase
VNPDYHEKLRQGGLVFSGVYPSKQGDIVEIVEWPSTAGFGAATQAHIELKSRLESPAPQFVEFMKAASVYQNKHE